MWLRCFVAVRNSLWLEGESSVNVYVSVSGNRVIFPFLLHVSPRVRLHIELHLMTSSRREITERMQENIQYTHLAKIVKNVRLPFPRLLPTGVSAPSCKHMCAAVSRYTTLHKRHVLPDMHEPEQETHHILSKAPCIFNASPP